MAVVLTRFTVRLSGSATRGRPSVSFGKQRSCLLACSLARVKDRHPCLGGIYRMRKQAIQGGVIEAALVLGVFRWRVADHLREPVAADSDVQAKNTRAIEVGQGIETLVVLGHDRGEGKAGMSPSGS